MFRSIVRSLLRGRPHGLRTRLWRRIFRSGASAGGADQDAAGADGKPSEGRPPASAAKASKGATPAEAGPTPAERGWTKVASLDEVPVDCPVEFFVDEQPVAIVRTASDLFVLGGVCPHADGPLGEGDVDEGHLTCPWHGWGFDLKTGKCRVAEDLSVQVYEAEIWEESVWVRPA